MLKATADEVPCSLTCSDQDCFSLKILEELLKVIIPLAGFGTRLRPHTYTKPKPLINVAGKPVLGHLLDKLKGLDIAEYIFIVGYLGEQVEDYVKNKYKLNATVHFVEQKELLG